MKNGPVRLLAGLVVVPLLFLWAGGIPGSATAFPQGGATADPTTVFD